MVVVVQLDVPLEDRRLLGDDRVELRGDGGKVVELRRRLEPLGCEPRGRCLEDASELDRIGDVAQREGAHDEPTAGERPEQPFVGERRQRQPERCARDPEPLGEIDLGDALFRCQLAREDELAQPERRLGRLRAGCVAARHVGDPIACSSAALVASSSADGPVLHARLGVSPRPDTRRRRRAVTLLPRDHGVAEDADPLDLGLDHVTRLEIEARALLG